MSAFDSASVQQQQRLNESYWQGRWSKGETGWRVEERGSAPFERNAKWILAELQTRTGVSSPRMNTLHDAFQGSTVFIPMCGDSLALGFWAKRLGCKVIGIDIVTDSLRKAITEQFADRDLGELPTDANGIACFELPARQRGEGDVLLLQGDVFSLLRNYRAYLEHVDIIYDRAALVAIEPERRASYIELLRRLMTVRKGEDSLNAELFNAGGSERTHKVMFLNTIERGAAFDISTPDTGISNNKSLASQGPPFHMGEEEVLEAFTTALGGTTRYVTPAGNNRDAFMEQRDGGDIPDFIDAFYVITAHSDEHLLKQRCNQIDG